ncbi:MAG: CDP-diacylglycerol--glycerol-3-phosphate 3-phosphatidyltransferase [Bdellovibrionales bacterium]|nr:CDP-diacylglycerol--glycerol-3-phosphate 3-phosphatidyltransferase [Bdellovibrionales bacterium]
MNSLAPDQQKSVIPHWKRELPMWLTWSRMVACIPMTVVMLTLEKRAAGWIAAAIFIVAAITDWLDGYFARKFHAQTTMGKFMDPIADKILVSTILILLIPSGAVHPVLVIIILGRDILIGGIRSIAAADRLIIDAKATGKWKTAVQMVAIPAVLIEVPLVSDSLGPLYNISTQTIGHGLLWISGILSLISGLQYINLYRNSKVSART